MIAWVNGSLTQSMVQRLLTWREPVWRWYLEMPLKEVRGRIEVVKLLGRQAVWMWSRNPPSPEEAVAAQQHKLGGWVWTNQRVLPWSRQEIKSRGRDLTIRLGAYVNASETLPVPWIERHILQGVEVVPYWTQFPSDIAALGWLKMARVKCPAGLQALLRSGQHQQCSGVSCLSIRDDRITGCRWCSGAGSLAGNKGDALPVLSFDVEHCGGCLLPWPHWDAEWRLDTPHAEV